MKNLVITIIYQEDLAWGWDVFYTEKGEQKKETFLVGDEQKFKHFVLNLLFTQFGIE